MPSMGPFGSFVGSAHAFDPTKVFKKEKPSARDLFRFYLKKKKEGDTEEAIDVLEYAADHGIDATVQDPKTRKPNIRAGGYGENFATNRRGAWTH